MKYIILKVTLGDEEPVEKLLPFIFSPVIVHSEMAETMSHHLAMRYEWFNVEPYSAGFINMNGECHGKSESMKISSKEGDTRLIKMYDYEHGLI